MSHIRCPMLHGPRSRVSAASSATRNARLDAGLLRRDDQIAALEVQLARQPDVQRHWNPASPLHSRTEELQHLKRELAFREDQLSRYSPRGAKAPSPPSCSCHTRLCVCARARNARTHARAATRRHPARLDGATLLSHVAQMSPSHDTRTHTHTHTHTHRDAHARARAHPSGAHLTRMWFRCRRATARARRSQ